MNNYKLVTAGICKQLRMS